jgi:tetratricopeptide (TPR) repeat protein
MPPAVREELSKLRADLADQRAATELVRRAAIEHVDRRSLELRAEIQAVQAVTQAEMRHVEQRVEEARPTRPAAPPDGLETRLAALTERIQALERKVAESSRPSAPVPTSPPAAAAPAPPRGGAPSDQLRALAARSAEVAAAAHLQLGDLALSAGDSERATAEYLRAVEIAPRGPDASRALLALGDAYRKAGRTRLAREAWSRAIRDFPGSEPARTARTRLDARD